MQCKKKRQKCILSVKFQRISIESILVSVSTFHSSDNQRTIGFSPVQWIAIAIAPERYRVVFEVIPPFVINHYYTFIQICFPKSI